MYRMTPPSTNTQRWEIRNETQVSDGSEGGDRNEMESEKAETDIVTSSLVILAEKAQSACIITFHFYFPQEHSKAHLHSCHTRIGVLFHSLSLSPSISLFPLPPTFSLSLFFFFIFLHLSFLFDLPFMSLH